MELVEIDERYRVTISRVVRKAFKIVKGQRLYLIPYGGDLLMKPVPMDSASELDELIGDFKFDRTTREKTAKWILRQAGK